MIIPSLVLTNTNPVITYTASVVTSGSIIADGLGNQITFLNVSCSNASTASYVLNGGGSGTTLTTGSTYPITSSWSISSSFASQSVSASWSPFVPTVSASWSSQSISSSHALQANSSSWAPFIPTVSASWSSASIFSTSASFSSQSLSASWAPFIPTVSASWASNSIFTTSSSFASQSISSSHAVNSDLLFVTSSNSNQPMSLLLTPTIGNDEQIYTDANNTLRFNPFSEILYAQTISATSISSSLTGSVNGTASNATTASYSPIQLPDITDDTVNHIVKISGSLNIFTSGSIITSPTLLLTGNDTSLTRSVYANYRRVMAQTNDYSSSNGTIGAAALLDIDSGNYGKIWLQGSSSFGKKTINLSANAGDGTFDGNLTSTTLNCDSMTGSLFGTASYTISASWAPSITTTLSASWASSSISSSYVSSASYAETASFALTTLNQVITNNTATPNGTITPSNTLVGNMYYKDDPSGSLSVWLWSVVSQSWFPMIT